MAVLGAGSDFDRPYQGQTTSDNLLNYAAQGSFAQAIQNLYFAGNPFVQEIVTHWGRVAKRRASALTSTVTMLFVHM